ncbi:hypothetical protein NSP_10840 [Nodularia spumigena CCY9414]|nr:hypothetical protein NSP_10840 [Nodularia spumigena CCY9414]
MLLMAESKSALFLSQVVVKILQSSKQALRQRKTCFFVYTKPGKARIFVKFKHLKLKKLR